MSFGDVIRSAAFTTRNDMNGIGGDDNAIWLCGTSIDWVCELSTVDFSAIRFTGAPNGYVQGIGGDINTIWSCGTYNVRRVYELSTVTLATIRSAPSPATWPVGIGGDADTIWCIDGLLYELSTVDFSTIRSASKPSSSGPTGIGGDANTIWFCDTTFDRVYELSTVDFSVVRYTSSPSYTPTGIGGNSDTIWSCDGNVRQIYELDAYTNLPPIADVGGPYDGVVDEIITFDGSGSTAPGGTIILYEWDFGDGHTDTGINTTHIYDTQNIYVITLTVTDDKGLTDVTTSSCAITIYIRSITPVRAYNNIDTNVIINGSGFIDGATVIMGIIPLIDIIFINSGQLNATIPLGINKGYYDILLTNPDTSNATLIDGFLSKVRIIDTAPTNKGSRLRSKILYNMID